MKQGTDIVFGISADTLKLVRSVLDGKSALQELQGAAAALDGELKKAEKANDSFGFSAARMAKQMDRMRESYDPVYASSKRYEAAVKKVEIAHEKNVISTQQYTAMLEGLGRKYLQVDAASEVLATGMTRVGRASQGGAGGLQNVGYQIQDFAVQVGAGTSATQAFAQQLPQLASGFGPVGIVIGTLAAVTIPLLAFAFKDLFDKAVTLEDAFGKVKQGLSDYEGYVKTAATETSKLTEQFGQFAGQVRGFSEYMAGVALGQTFDDLRATIEPLKGGLAEVQSAFAALTASKQALAEIDFNENPQQWADAKDAVALYDGALNEAAATLGIMPGQALALASAMDNVAKAKTMEDIALYAGEALAIIKQIAPAGAELPAPLRAAAVALEEMQRKAAEAAKATKDLSGSAPGAGWMGAAIGETNLLIGRLIEAKRVNDAISGQLASMQSARIGDTDRGGQRATVAGANTNMPDQPWMSAGGGSGGSSAGGGGADPMQARIEALVQSLKTEDEITAEWYATSLEALNAASEAELAAIGGKHSAIERLEQEHQERLAGIKGTSNSDMLSQTTAFLGGMAQALQGGNDRMVKIAQKFAAAEALINAWRAFSQTMADETLPWFMKIPQAAANLAAGMKAVQALGGSGGGGGGGARGGGGSATPAPAAQPSGQYLNFQFNGGWSSTEDMGRFMVKAINQAVENGAQIRGARIV